MKIRLSNITNEPLHLDEEFDLSHINTNDYPSLVAIDDIFASITISRDDDFIDVDIYLTGVITLECAYTLDHFEKEVEIEELITFTENQILESEDVFYLDTPSLEIEPLIYGLILSEVPIKAVKPGATLPKGGEGYRIISEDDYYEEIINKQNEPNERMAALDDLFPFDDEEE